MIHTGNFTKDRFDETVITCIKVENVNWKKYKFLSGCNLEKRYYYLYFKLDCVLNETLQWKILH